MYSCDTAREWSTVAGDIDKLIAWACSQGWTVTVDANGYRRFHTPDRNLRDSIPRYPE